MSKKQKMFIFHFVCGLWQHNFVKGLIPWSIAFDSIHHLCQSDIIYWIVPPDFSHLHSSTVQVLLTSFNLQTGAKVNWARKLGCCLWRPLSKWIEIWEPFHRQLWNRSEMTGAKWQYLKYPSCCLIITITITITSFRSRQPLRAIFCFTNWKTTTRFRTSSC